MRIDDFGIDSDSDRGAFSMDFFNVSRTSRASAKQVRRRRQRCFRRTSIASVEWVRIDVSDPDNFNEMLVYSNEDP